MNHPGLVINREAKPSYYTKDSETELLDKNNKMPKVLKQFGDRSKLLSFITADAFHVCELTQPRTAGKFSSSTCQVFSGSVKILWLPLGNGHNNPSMWIIWETQGWKSGSNWWVTGHCRQGMDFGESSIIGWLWEHHPRLGRAVGAQNEIQDIHLTLPSWNATNSQEMHHNTGASFICSYTQPVVLIIQLFFKEVFFPVLQGNAKEEKHPKWQQELVFTGENLKFGIYHTAWSRQKTK